MAIPKKTSSKRRAVVAPKVRIRMYNVGFGDSFLLTFPTEEGERRVLIDCGVHMSGPGPRPVREVARQIIEDVKDEDGNARIDLVVATHRHADHVSGFDIDDWNDVTVHEVWMPWTENYDDRDAVKILQTQSKVAKKLAAMKGAAPQVVNIAENSLVNAAAMKNLHEGLKGKPRRRFLPTKQGKQMITTKHLPGVKVHVLGPSRDPEVIRDMNPPKHHSYLRAAAQEEELQGKPLRPFRDAWALSAERYRELGFTPIAGADIGHLKNMSKTDAFALAASLESSVNGTSLMLMFEVGSAFLLFPGDAQWGTWDAAIRESGDLLEKTTFYKVGHHGSHNATPTDFVDLLGDTPALAAAMVCTRAKVKDWDIPRGPLLTRLRKITNVARSDETRDTPEVFTRGPKNAYVDYEVPI